LKWLVSVLVWQGLWVLVLVVGGCLWCRSSVRVACGGSGLRWAGVVPTLGPMSDAVMLLDRIAARRAELNVLAEQLVKQLAEVRAERDELVVAERVVQRISEQGSGEYTSLAPPEARPAGRCCRSRPVSAVPAPTRSRRATSSSAAHGPSGR